MARERERLAEKAQRESARWAKAKQDGAEHRATYGPLKVTGRDRVPVQLEVQPSGVWGFNPGDDLIGLVLFILPMVLAYLLTHHVLFRGGYTLHITARGRKKIKIRLRSKEAAAQRLREVADAVRRNGVAALSTVRQ